MLETAYEFSNGLALSNRLVRSAMTEALADAHDDPSPELFRLYERYGRAGFGMVITGNVGVDRNHPVRPGDAMIDDQTSKEGLAEWARRAKAGGAKVIVQVNHAGRQTPGMVNRRPIAPSEVAAVKFMKAFGPPRAATQREIEQIIERFVRAAQLLEAAGFDGIQLHAAHGYLMSQFLSPLTNLRTDAWGGSVENRARLLVETTKAVRAAVSKRFTVGVKLNTADFMRGGMTEEESLEVAIALDEVGLDFLELSGGSYEAPASFGVGRPRSGREAYFLSFAERARSVVKAPLLLTGGFRSRGAMVQALESGAVDLVGLARPVAIEPELPKRLLASLPPLIAERTKWAGIKRIDSASEMAWYGAQLRRMGDGMDPDPNASPLWAFVQYLVADLVKSRARRAAKRAALPEGALAAA
jgi:2,4-dienoyl-CoA reductase-like NADH-dependent reductase (Old Yellow Enzyme family)